MRKHWWVFGLIAGIAATCAVVLHGSRDQEPRYRGRALSQYLHDYGLCGTREVPWAMREPIAASVKAIGTNALPWLITWLQYEPAPWQTNLEVKLRNAPDALSDHAVLTELTFNRRKLERSMDAVQGFEILGAQATAAAPQLTRLMNDDTQPDDLRRRAADALGCLGVAGLPALTEAMTNSAPRLRLHAIRALSRVRELGANAEAVIPPLILRAQDVYGDIAAAAVQTLGRLDGHAEVVVPALTNAFQSPNREARFWAVRSFLLWLPQEAPRAAPSLEALRNDPDYLIREDVATILARLQARSTNAIPPAAAEK